MLSYVTDLAASETLLEQWNDLSAAMKAAHLVNASRRLDGLMTWIGDRYSEEQNLKWPRVNAVVDGFLIDSITFPLPVKSATCEMALWLMTNENAIAVTQGAAYSAIRVGPINVDFNDKLATASEKYCPDMVAIILADYGELNSPDLPGSNKLKVARLFRA
jgi:hypothetical protein